MDPETGVIAVQLSSDLDGDPVSQPGGFYAYTFGTPVVPLVRDPGFEWADVQGLAGDFNHGEQLTQNTVDRTFTDSTTNSQRFAGIAGNNGVYTTGNPQAPQGLQAGFVQGDSSISQTVTLGRGTYTLTLYAAQSAKNKNQPPQSLNVLVDGNPVGTIEPNDTNYERSSIRFAVGAGRHTITFQGTQMSDSTVLIDAIECSQKIGGTDGRFPGTPNDTGSGNANALPPGVWWPAAGAGAGDGQAISYRDGTGPDHFRGHRLITSKFSSIAPSRVG
jgi:hypothetical protein